MAAASKYIPNLTLEVMVSRKEGQYYDVKSAQKKAPELADIVSGGSVEIISLCQSMMTVWKSRARADSRIL